MTGSGVLEFNVYATLQTSASDLQQDPSAAFEPAVSAGGFHADSVKRPSVLDGPPSPARMTPPPPPAYPKPSTVPADRQSVADVPLLGDVESIGSDVVDPSWENFADLEFPRDALDPIDTLGNSSFGEVIVTCNRVRTAHSAVFSF